MSASASYGHSGTGAHAKVSVFIPVLTPLRVISESDGGNPLTGLATGLGGEDRCTIGNMDLVAVEMNGDPEATISR
jgi:hypothetical protein